MEYWLTSPGDHLDFGFGITAETYYNSAKYMDAVSYTHLTLPTNIEV